MALWKRKKFIRPFSTVIFKKTFSGGKNTWVFKAWNLSQNFSFRPEIYQGQFFYINLLFTVLGSSMATPFPIMFFFFITGKMYFPTSLCYLTPCEITILRALGPAQYGTFHYWRKDCSKSNKTARIFRFFKFFLPRHPFSPRNLLLSPVVEILFPLKISWFYILKY